MYSSYGKELFTRNMWGAFRLGLRKPKNTVINKCVTKLGDLRPVLLATCLAKLHPCLTEISLMRLGGELHEMRRKHLSDFRSTDNAQSLELRMQLAQGLAHAEKSWRMRLIGVIGEGQLKSFTNLLNRSYDDDVDKWMMLIMMLIRI